MAARKIAIEDNYLTEMQVTQIWEAMLDAETNVAYWGKLIHGKQRLDQRAKIFVAVMSSSTVASWNIWSNYPAVWKTVSCVAAVVSIIQAQLHLNRDVTELTHIYGKWTKIYTEYHELVYSVAPKVAGSEAWSGYSKLMKEEDALAEISIKFPIDERLHRKCAIGVQNLHLSQIPPAQGK